MKKLICVLAAGIILSACKIDESYMYGYDVVEPAQVAFEGVYMALVKDMGNASFVLAANDYIQGDAAKKEEMQNGVFDDVSIMQSGDEWKFEYLYGGGNETVIYVINTRGIDLGETDAAWHVAKSDHAGSKAKTDSEGKFTIKCTGPETWTMEIDGFGYYNWNRNANNPYIVASEAVLTLKRLSLTERDGYQSMKYNVNGNSEFKSGHEDDFLISSIVSGAEITVTSDAGNYPFARKKTRRADFILRVENGDRRPDDITATITSDEVSVIFRRKSKVYQLPDFTGIPKPSKPKPKPTSEPASALIPMP